MFAIPAQPILLRDGANRFLTVVLSLASRNAAVAADLVRRARCRLSGHVLMLHFEPHRLALHCVSCGHTTPGWSIQDHPGR